MKIDHARYRRKLQDNRLVGMILALASACMALILYIISKAVS